MREELEMYKQMVDTLKHQIREMHQVEQAAAAANSSGSSGAGEEVLSQIEDLVEERDAARK